MGRTPTHAEIGKWISDASEALGLFPSVIKSGEKWSETCEDVRSRAREAISRLGETGLLAALSTPAAQPVEGDWRSFETAPKDGDYILAIVAPNESRHLGHHSGRMFVIRHEGYTAPSEFDMGWAVYPGFGGAPDSYFSLWMPLPSAPQQAREGQS
jgi:hypothetical protein